MKTIARSELRNALEALPLYEAQPCLELSERLEDGIFPSSTEMIRLIIASLYYQMIQEG